MFENDKRMSVVLAKGNFSLANHLFKLNHKFLKLNKLPMLRFDKNFTLHGEN